jgi:hypothetical protein
MPSLAGPWKLRSYVLAPGTHGGVSAGLSMLVVTCENGSKSAAADCSPDAEFTYIYIYSQYPVASLTEVRLTTKIYLLKKFYFTLHIYISSRDD